MNKDGYQALTGLSTMDIDTFTADNANIITLNVSGSTTLNGSVQVNGTLQINPVGAVDDILTSDSLGNATWQVPAIPVLAGDAVGFANANQVNTLANGTIPVSDVVLLNAPQTLTNKTIDGAFLTNLTTADDLDVGGNLQTLSFQMATGALGSRVMTSDPFGNGSWQPIPPVVLVGDASGSTSATVVNTLGNGGINVYDLVTLTGTETLTNKAITGTFTGSLTGNSSTSTLASLATTVTTNANLTGDVTSVGNTTTLTNAPVIAKVLTGFTSGAGTVTSSDSILTALQKINGNMVSASGVSTATANTLALRDSTASCAFADITSNRILTSAGKIALQYLDGGANIVRIGDGAFPSNTAENIGIGYQAGLQCIGTDNVAIGHQAMIYALNGSHNTCVGNLAGAASNSNSCSAFGFNSGCGNNITEGTAIGAGAACNANYTIVLGSISAQFLKIPNTITTINASALTVTPALVTSSSLTVNGLLQANSAANVNGVLTVGGALQANSTSTVNGLFTNKSIQWCNNQFQNKVINLFDNGTVTDGNGTNFLGFGVNSGTLRYNTPAGNFHRFYSDTVLCATIGSSGILLATSGGTASYLNHYEEAGYTTNFTGVIAAGVNNVNYSVTRVGRVVTLTQAAVTYFTGAAGTNGQTFTATTALPVRFRPFVEYNGTIVIYEQSQRVAGILTISTAGIMNIAPANGNGFNLAWTPIGWRQFAVTYAIS